MDSERVDDEETERHTPISEGTTNNGGNDSLRKRKVEDDVEKYQENGNVTLVDMDVEDPTTTRETWSGKIDFLLACIGFSVGLGNVWRFPYLCYKNGGGAFLIPYFICVIVAGVPLFFLEVAVGQFMSIGGLRAWNIVPMFQGIAVANNVTMFTINCYYNVILAWALYYLFASFTTVLPWSNCDQHWNTEFCTTNFDPMVDVNVSFGDIILNMDNSSLCDDTERFSNGSVLYFDGSMGTVNDTFWEFCRNLTFHANKVHPVTEFWERKVLSISSGIEDLGILKWDLVLCLMLAWIIVYLCICKGIKSSGKVMYVTATSPYIFMIILLIRGATLPGAKDGVLFYLTPDFNKLLELEVWVDAGTQIFFSYSIAMGALTALGSYNKFRHNAYRDCIIFALTNSGTSLLAGFVVFSALGNMALELNLPITEVAESGPGLTFIAYPKALSTMPAAPVWSVVFFIMVILLGLDSEMVGVEGVITAVVDQYPQYLRKGYRKEIFTAVVCIITFLVGLPMCTEGGMYIFQLFDYYGGSKIILLIAFFESITVAWIYGIRRFYDNLEMMLGYRLGPYMYVGWLVTAPIFCLSVFVMGVINYTELSYKRTSGTYHYPGWAVGIGWSMAVVSIIWIPIVMVYKIAKYSNAVPILKLLAHPSRLKSHQLRPQDVYEESIDQLVNTDQVNLRPRAGVYPSSAIAGMHAYYDGAGEYSQGFEMSESPNGIGGYDERQPSYPNSRINSAYEVTEDESNQM